MNNCEDMITCSHGFHIKKAVVPLIMSIITLINFIMILIVSTVQHPLFQLWQGLGIIYVASVICLSCFPLLITWTVFFLTATGYMKKLIGTIISTIFTFSIICILSYIALIILTLGSMIQS